ncbi:MAG: hypothetical protein PF637_09530 [Spirochaetes bacterium]|nr:hypothetical protein [Spirochaetota bacterium]
MILKRIIILLKDQNYSRTALLIILILLTLLLAPFYRGYSTFLYRLSYSLSLPFHSSETVAYSSLPDHTAAATTLIQAAATARIAGAETVVICGAVSYSSSLHISRNLFEKIASGEQFSFDLLTKTDQGLNTGSKNSHNGTTTLYFPYLISLLQNNKKDKTNNSLDNTSSDITFADENLSDIIDLSGTFIPLFTGGKALPLHYRTDGKDYTHVSLAIYNNSKKKNANYTSKKFLPYYYDTPFQKNPILNINFTTLMNYSDLMHEKNTHLSLLAFYTGNSEFSDISDGLLQLLQRAVSHPEDPILREMYLSAEEDTNRIGSIIYSKASSLNTNELTPREKRGIAEALKAVDTIEQKLKPFEALKGKTLFIEQESHTAYAHLASPRFFGSYNTPGYQSALILANLRDNRGANMGGSVIQFIFLLFAAALIYIVFYKYPLTIGLKKTGILFLFVNLIIYLIFQFFGVYIETGYIHILFFLACTGMFVEQKVRVAWFLSLRKKAGLNISPITIEKIASSIKPIRIPETANATLLYIQIQNLPEIASQLSARDFDKMILTLNNSFRIECEGREGVLVSLERGIFCSAYGLGFATSEPVTDAVETALIFQKTIGGINKSKLMSKKSLTLDFLAAIDYAQLASRISSRGDYNLLTLYGTVLSVVRSMIKISLEYDAPLVITEDALNRIETLYTWRNLDRVKFANCNITTNLYQIMGRQDLYAALSDFLSLYEEGQRLFYQKQFKEARQFFRKATRLYSGDGPSQHFIKRCSYYMKSDKALKRTIDVS